MTKQPPPAETQHFPRGNKWDSNTGREKSVTEEGCQGWDTPVPLSSLLASPSHSSPTLHKRTVIFRGLFCLFVCGVFLGCVFLVFLLLLLFWFLWFVLVFVFLTAN